MIFEKIERTNCLELVFLRKSEVENRRFYLFRKYMEYTSVESILIVRSSPRALPTVLPS